MWLVIALLVGWGIVSAVWLLMLHEKLEMKETTILILRDTLEEEMDRRIELQKRVP